MVDKKNLMIRNLLNSKHGLIEIANSDGIEALVYDYDNNEYFILYENLNPIT